MALSYVASLILVSDVLTETKMKPWWEVVRGIAVVVMFVTALIMLPLSMTSTIHCIPPSNVTLTNPETSYVNGACSGDIHFVISKLTSTILLLVALIIHFWYSWWLMIPSVITKFRTVRDANDALKELVLLKEDIVELGLHSPFASRNIHKIYQISENDSSIEKHCIVIRKVARSLWLCPHPTCVVRFYSIRNIVGSVFLMAVSGLSVWLIFSLLSQGTEFQCKKELTVKEVKFSDFSCSSDFSFIPFIVLTFVYTIFVILQLGLTIFICFRSRNKKDDWELIKQFAKKSTELTVGTQCLLLSREEVTKEMKPFLKKAAEVRDFDFINLYHELGDVKDKNEELQKAERKKELQKAERKKERKQKEIRKKEEEQKEEEQKEIREIFKCRMDEKEVTDEDLKELSKYCMEKKMYESFVLAHYKNFGRSSEKNYDYKDCGCCNLALKFNTIDESTGKSLLHYVIRSRAKTENGEVIFNCLAIKHLLQDESTAAIPRFAQDIETERGQIETIPLLPRDNVEDRRRKQLEDIISNMEEVEMFELSLILQECGYGDEIGIKDVNRKRYNVYRAIMNSLEKGTVQFNFSESGGSSVTVDDKKSFYKKISKFWFNSRMYKEFSHLHKLVYDKNICPEMDKFDIYGYCGCDELTFMPDDTEPGPNGCSLLYYVLEDPDVESEAMKHMMYWTNKWKSLEHRKVLKRGIDKIELSPIDYLSQDDEISQYDKVFVLSSYKEVAAKMLDFATIEQEDSDLKNIAVDRIRNRSVSDDDLRRLTRQCMDKCFYIILVLAHYKCFGQSSKRNFDYDECGCSSAVGFDDVKSYESGRTLFDHVLDDRIWNENGEIIFNPLAVEHFLYWNREYRVSQGIQTNPFLPLKDYFNHEEPEKLELCYILSKIEHVDSQNITGKNLQYYNFYRAIRIGEEVTAEMKNFVFGDDKSFYKELSQFWLRNKFYREYVELHKLFYSFRNYLNHETIDCGCDKMTFHLTDTEPGSKGRSLLYYVLVNLDPGSEAMKHVLKWGREKQNDSENGEVKVVIRDEGYVGSPMDYVNQSQNFNEPARERLIQTLQDYEYLT